MKARVQADSGFMKTLYSPSPRGHGVELPGRAAVVPFLGESDGDGPAGQRWICEADIKVFVGLTVFLDGVFSRHMLDIHRFRP